MKVIQEDGEKRRAQLERIAASAEPEAENARKTLEAEKEALKIQQRVLGVSERRTKKTVLLNEPVKRQEEIMKAQKDELEAMGLDASENKKYRKEEIKLARMELRRAQATGSKAAEKEAKKKLDDKRGNTYLGKISDSLTNIWKSGKEKVKSGLSGFMKLAYGAFAIAALAFLNSPYFGKLVKELEDLLPYLAKFYDDYIHPIYLWFKDKLGVALCDFKAVLDGKMSWLDALWNNKIVVASIITALAPGTVLWAVSKGAVGLGKLIAATWKSGAAANAFTATGLAKTIGAVAIFHALHEAIKDYKIGEKLAEQWKVGDVAAGIGGALAGFDKKAKGSWLKSMFSKKTMEWVMLGAGIGTVFPVIGTIIGGLVGGVIGTILSYLGAEKVAKIAQQVGDMFTKFYDEVVTSFKEFFGLLEDDEKEALANRKVAQKRIEIRQMTKVHESAMAKGNEGWDQMTAAEKSAWVRRDDFEKRLREAQDELVELEFGKVSLGAQDLIGGEQGYLATLEYVKNMGLVHESTKKALDQTKAGTVTEEEAAAERKAIRFTPQGIKRNLAKLKGEDRKSFVRELQDREMMEQFAAPSYVNASTNVNRGGDTHISHFGGAMHSEDRVLAAVSSVT